MLNDKISLVHQITGSSLAYTMKPLETVTLMNSSTYLEKVCIIYYLQYLLILVPVGSVHKDHVSVFSNHIATLSSMIWVGIVRIGL